MALTRPVLLSVPAFDAANSQAFVFTVPGNSAQIVANKLTIRIQSNNTVVYQEKQESFKYEHVVSPDELTNNTYYSATVTVFDNDGNESPESIPIQFYCYTTPIISFTNFPVNNIIQNASFNFQFSYTQKEGEKLNSYVVNLYNNFDSLIASSGTQYPGDGTPPFNGAYLFTGFENTTAYSIEVVGTTINGTIVSTGVIDFSVQYLRPDIFTVVELTNNCDEGYIGVRSNIVIIAGDSNPDPPIYINNKEVDLTEPDSWVKWDEGYNITGDFRARIWFRDPNPNSKILQFSNISGQTIEVYYMEGYENVTSQNKQSYIEVYVNSLENNSYYVFSNFIDILSETDYYIFWLTRKNYIYQAQLAQV